MFRTKGLIPFAFTPITETSKGVEQIIEMGEEAKVIPRGLVPPLLKKHSADVAIILLAGPFEAGLAARGWRVEEALRKAAFGDGKAAQAIKGAIGRLPKAQREKTWGAVARVIGAQPKTAAGRGMFRAVPEFKATTPSALRTAAAEVSEIRTPSEAKVFIDRLAGRAPKGKMPSEVPLPARKPLPRPPTEEAPLPVEAPRMPSERPVAPEGVSYGPTRELLPSEKAAPAAPTLESFVESRGADVAAIRSNRGRMRVAAEEMKKTHPEADVDALMESFAAGRRPGEGLEYALGGELQEPAIRAHDVARAMEKSLGTRLNVKLRGVQRLGNKFWAAAGRFSRAKFVGATRKIDDVETLMHEYGHGVEMKLFGKKAPEVWKPVERELEQLGHAIYGDLVPDAPPEFFAREGFAEFMWMWLGKPQQTAARAPLTHNWWTKEILPRNPKFSKELLDIQKMVTGYAAQAPEGRIVGGFARPGEAAFEFDPVLTKTQRKRLRRKERHWDEAAFLKQVQDDILGKKAIGPYDFFGAMRGTAGARATRALTDVQESLDGQVIGRGALDILRPVLDRGHLSQLMAYHRAKHAEHSILKRGIQTGDRIEDALAVVAKYETNPEYAHILRAQGDVTKFYQNELRIWAKEARADALVERFVAANPYYMPMKRFFPDLAGGSPTGTAGSNLAKRRGGTRLVKDYLDQLRDYTLERRSQAVWTRIKRKVAELAERPMAGGYIEEVQGARVPPIYKRLQSMERDLKKAGADLTEADMDTVLELWSQAQKLPVDEPIFALRLGDDTKYFRVHPELFREMQAWQEGEMNVLMRASRYITGIRRMGITGINPEFGLANFFARDLFTSFITDPTGKGVGFAPLHLYRNLKGLGRAVRGALGDLFPSIKQTKIVNKILRDKVVEVYRGLGLDMSELLARDRDLRLLFTRQARPNVFKSIKNLAVHPIDSLRILMGPFESGARLAQAERVMKARGLLKPGAVFGEKDALAIAQAAGEVSVNFRRMGTVGKQINRVRVFHNAQVQGLVLTARTFAKHPIRTTARGLTWITSPTLGLWYMNRDNPDYQALPAWRRMAFWNIPIGKYDDGSTKWLAIPIPFEFGIIFKSVPEALANAAYNADKDAFKANEDLEGL
ncbi:MAG: LPD38 domain-containing protein, partial [Planctomycetota bacterium]